MRIQNYNTTSSMKMSVTKITTEIRYGRVNDLILCN